jgi:hypothetical protein
MSDVKPVIFISYSHRDEPERPGPNEECWLTFVQSHLQPAVKHGIYDLWVDEDIPGGGAWREDITKKLDECDVCVLLVSRHSLASDFIIDVEIETLRNRREKGEVEIFPIVLTPCAVQTAPWIREINLRPPNGRPLSDFRVNERHKQMALIAAEIAALAERMTRRGQVQVQQQIYQQGGWRDRQQQQQQQLQGCHVDIKHLPETAYENLVGREYELKRLDEAWIDSHTNILSLVAEGGAGKSALVNEWLKRMRLHEYPPVADTVLGWSFYSQGTKERATSAEQFLNWALDELRIKIETTSATAKGEAIAEAMMERRVLLVLDGCEPLQHGFDRQQGELKDHGLRALLRRFAAMPPAKVRGLIVLTSRLPVKDLAKWTDSTAPVLNVEQLSDEAGAALLRDNGVWGTNKELRAATRDFDGHPLALGLLASFLNETQTGDVRRRDHVGALVLDDDNPRHGHAKRVMESYEKEWLDGQPVLLAILQIVGLFDRPASHHCLRALRTKPVIDGLTDVVIGLDEGEWGRSVARLREVRLLAPVDPSAPDVLDAHPLVREWFGARLKRTNEAAWKAAHGRVYEHLRDTTKEGRTPTLEDLTPLYQAITHGCRAGWHRKTLEDIYIDRICRRTPRGSIEFYSIKKLGSIGSDLAAISWFFDKPYATTALALGADDQSWVLSTAAFGLRAQGRFAEAVPAMRAAQQMAEDTENWNNAALAASNLSETELLVGEIAAAVATAERSVAHADHGGDDFLMMVTRVTMADALHAAGALEAAALLFADAEGRQKQQQPEYPLLYSLQGYRYCDLLLTKRDRATARDRASKVLEWTRTNASRLSIALHNLTLGRAHLGLALLRGEFGKHKAVAQEDAHIGNMEIDEAIEGLRASGQNDSLPRGLLARVALLRSIGNWSGAARDLDEVEEIAEPGPMKLHLCDMAIERARLAFANIEAFAPLNDLFDDSPPKPVAPDAAEVAHLKVEAAKQLAIAADYIGTCGYHKRDEELAELEVVLRGEQKFADLPPRV